MKIISIVGARPNFMKIAPFCKALQKRLRDLSEKNRANRRGGNDAPYVRRGWIFCDRAGGELRRGDGDSAKKTVPALKERRDLPSLGAFFKERQVA